MKSPNKQKRVIFPAISKPRREDWDFDKVPDEELTTCYFYEYARESTALSRIIDHRLYSQHRLAKGLISKKQYERESCRIRKIYSNMSTPLPIKPLVFYFIVGLDGLWKKQSFEDTPWQLLDYQTRRRFLPGLAPFRSCIIDEFYDLRDSIKANLEKADSGNWDGLTDYRGRPYIEPFYGRGNTLRILVGVDWRFTDGEIIESFKKFVKCRRPEQHLHPRRKGDRLSSIRDALRWLGVMRNMAYSTTRMMFRKTPEFWDDWASWRSTHKSSIHEVMVELRRRAAIRFHEIIPFDKQAPFHFATSIQRKKPNEIKSFPQG